MREATVAAIKKFDELPTSKVVLFLLVALLLGDKGLTSLDRVTGVDRVLLRLDAVETNVVAHIDHLQEAGK